VSHSLYKAGFDSVLSSPTIITHIAYSLHGTSLKTRKLAAELLGAICVLSLNHGHKAVMAALSEYRIAYDESFRFESLVAALRIQDGQSNVPAANDAPPVEEEGIWEARIAFMTLVNALTNCPDSLEDRILLREEFGRRGLGEVIVVRYFLAPRLITFYDVEFIT
jgi:diaphanous 1